MVDLKFILNEHTEHLELSGDIAEICAAICRLVNVTYVKLYRMDPSLGNSMKFALVGAMLDPRSPVWNKNSNVTGNVADVGMFTVKREEGA